MIDRHNKILELIQQYSIDTQDELSRHLTQLGYKVTQATVSRDIKKLRLLKKVDDDGKSRYVSGDSQLFASSVIDVDYAENLIVIKTFPGMAQAIGAAIDALSVTDILGSIAGDDTIIVVARNKEIAKEVVKRFNDMR